MKGKVLYMKLRPMDEWDKEYDEWLRTKATPFERFCSRDGLLRLYMCCLGIAVAVLIGWVFTQ